MAHKLQELLADINGNTFISIDTVTVPRLNGGQANPHLNKVRKVTIGSNVMVFQNKLSNAYTNMVKRRLAQEGKDPESFELSPRIWGERIHATPFIEKDGQLYLEVVFLKAGVTHYELGARVIEKDQVIGLKPKREAKQGGLQNKVVTRTIHVDNIKQITINKQVHVL